MIKCPFCLSPHVLNTIFCSECGLCMLQSEEITTDPLDSNKISRIGELFSNPEVVQALQPGSGPMTIRLEIGLQPREVQVVLTRVVYLGRLDPTSNIFPEIDLTLEGCY